MKPPCLLEILRGRAGDVQSTVFNARMRGQDPFAAIQQLAQSVQALANSPRTLNVSSPDAVGDIGKVLAGISRQRVKGARL